MNKKPIVRYYSGMRSMFSHTREDHRENHTQHRKYRNLLLISRYSREEGQYDSSCNISISDILAIVLSSLVHLVSIFLYKLLQTQGECHSHLWCSTRYTSWYVDSLMSWPIRSIVAFRDKIRSKTVKRDYKTLHSNVEFFILLLLYIRD